MKFPKQIYVKRERSESDGTSWLLALPTIQGIVEADETEDVAVYNLAKVTKVSAPTRMK